MLHFILGIMVGGVFGVIGVSYGNWVRHRMTLLIKGDNVESCNHQFVQVNSSGKTVKEIIQMAPLSMSFAGLELEIDENRYSDGVVFIYRGRRIYVDSVLLPTSIVYNKVCLKCGECSDYHGATRTEIQNGMRKIDEEIENLAYAEKIYEDNCLGKE